MRNRVVVNNRWGKDATKTTGSYYSTQYSNLNDPKPKGIKWEEMRGMGKSFGYSRVETLDDYSTSEELVEMLIKVVATGGNLLLNVGPTSDGRIPVIMQQRLADMGGWLNINGKAIFGTKPYEYLVDGLPYVVENDGHIYVHLLDWPGEDIYLPGDILFTEAKLMGLDEPLMCEKTDNKWKLSIPLKKIDIKDFKYAYVLVLNKP